MFLELKRHVYESSLKTVGASIMSYKVDMPKKSTEYLI